MEVEMGEMGEGGGEETSGSSCMACTTTRHKWKNQMGTVWRARTRWRSFIVCMYLSWKNTWRLRYMLGLWGSLALWVQQRERLQVVEHHGNWEGFVCVDWLTLCFGSSSSARKCLSFFLNLFIFLVNCFSVFKKEKKREQKEAEESYLWFEPLNWGHHTTIMWAVVKEINKSYISKKVVKAILRVCFFSKFFILNIILLISLK